MKTNRILHFFLLGVVIAVSNNLSAQIATNALSLYDHNTRIGLVDEFFDRFNGKTTNPALIDTDINARKANLMMLFDLSQFSLQDDPKYIEAAGMIDVVMNDSIKINYSDSTWAALAHCNGTLDGKKVNFDLFLSVQHRKENMYKWVISKADGTIFNTSSKNTSEKIMLYPDDHETNFISLGRMTREQPFNVNNFIRKGFKYDPTSVFSYLVYNNRLKIENVDDLEFIFTQIPDYIFHIKYFKRKGANAGWLISNFYKSTTDDKYAFFKQLYLPSFNNEFCESIDSIVAVIDDNIGMNANKLHNLYCRRLNEKCAQLCDYIGYMQQNDSLRAHSIYSKKMRKLFDQDAKAIIQNKKTGDRTIVSVEEFCNKLIDRKITFVSIDSIAIPLWDDIIVQLDESVHFCDLSSHMVPFVVPKLSCYSSALKLSTRLFAYKEETENGIEWLPILGNIIISVN